MTEQEFERRLRASLTTHSREAPRSDQVERRVLDAVVVTPSRRRIPWRALTAPIIAAGAVAALVAALVGIEHDRPSASNDRIAPATQVAPTPSSPAPVRSQTPAVRALPVPTSTQTVPGAARVQVKDLTFVGNEAWALDWTACANDPAVSCSGMLHSGDGGRTWQQATAPVVTEVTPGCMECPWHVRFATSQIGYVYNPSVLFMTTDGGQTWHRQSGGADELETLDGNVVRVVAVPHDCSPPGCTYTAQTAALGSSTWRETGLRAQSKGMSSDVGLTRTGSTVVIAVLGHPAGGASDAHSTLYLSHDDGGSWIPRDDPCVTRDDGVEVDTTSLTSAPDGSIVVLCTRRDGTGGEYPAVSTDGGSTFRAGQPVDGIATLIAASSRSVVVLGDEGLLRSGDGGDGWSRVLRDGEPTWLGFESENVGHAVSGDGVTLYRTDDAGVTWIATAFT